MIIRTLGELYFSWQSRFRAISGTEQLGDLPAHKRIASLAS